MINALETVIQYLKGAGLSTSQIASKDRFGETWPVSSQAIVVNLDGGNPDLYLPVQNVRLEIRCYGPDRWSALTLLDEVIELSRATCREEVTVSGGTAMLYRLLQASGPSALFDDELQMDFALMFFEAMVCERGVEP